MKIDSLKILYQKNKEKTIHFNEDISIITGRSKKGKSAILEIIDYCLFSSSNIVPEGKVKNESTIFVLVLVDKENKVYIYRDIKTNKMKIDFIDKSDEYNFNYKNIEINKGNVQEEFEKYLGINITSKDVKRFDITNDSKAQKFSIRYQIPYNLLAQNIIANKDVLFRNFSESRYRKNIREQFKFFCGLENLDDYILNQKIKNKEKEIKKNKRLYETNEETEKNLLSEVNLFLESFKFPNVEKLEKFLSIDELFFVSNKNENLKKEEYELLIKKIKECKEKIKETKENNANDEYILKQINEHQTMDIIKKMDIKEEKLCPICEKPDDTYEIFIEELEKSQKQNNSFNANNKIFVRELNHNISVNNEEIKSLTKKLNDLSSQKEKYNENMLTKSDVSAFYKGYEELKNKINFLKNKDILEKLEKELNELKKGKKENKKSINEFEQNLSTNLKQIVKEFDIEEEFLSMDLKFDIKKFDYYFKKGKDEKHLSNTGSGANWLAMHIALNFGILKTVKDMGLNSTLFNFIILDQPTQAYFTTSDESKDYETVKNMFTSLFKLAEETDIQILILEHAISNDFKGENELEEKYKKCEIENWHDDNTGLLEE